MKKEIYKKLEKAIKKVRPGQVILLCDCCHEVKIIDVSSNGLSGNLAFHRKGFCLIEKEV